MSIEFTPYVVPLTLSALISATLGIIIWRRRPGVGITSFAVMMIALTEWSLCSALQHAFTDLDAKLLWVNLSFIGIPISIAAWLAFTLEYTGRQSWLTRRNVILLSIEPILVFIFSATSEWNHLFRGPVSLDTATVPPSVASAFGPLFWVHAAYSYILMVAGTVFLVRAYFRSQPIYRGQLAVVLMGAMAPWLANAIFIFGFSPFPNLDITPFAFTITGASMAWGIYRYKLLDIVPIARDLVIESMDDALLVLDARNRIVELNRPAVTLLQGTSKSDLIGKPATELLAARQDLIEQYGTAESARGEINVVRGEKTLSFDLRLLPIRNNQNDLVGRMILLHDITERKALDEHISRQNAFLQDTNRELSLARQKAEDANRIKSEFLANMSHELRTPLNAVIGYADLMLQGLGTELPPREHDYVQRILTNGDRLLYLINELLDLSKIEAGRLELINKPFVAGDLVQRVITQMQGLIGDKTIAVTGEVDPQLAGLRIIADANRLEQILVNLVGNGIKFTEAGSVTLRAEKAGDSQWRLLVTDTGIGIPPHAHDLIFEEFRQLDGSEQRKYEGTGLGLAIVQRLVDLMRGTITVDSEVGKGSTFTVLLPLDVMVEQAVS
jgi:PAS domain S-box-containing protein